MSSLRQNRTALLVLVTGYAALVLLAGLGLLPLFGRDESLYAEAAREMHASGDWVVPRVNDVPFLEKPPLNYWLVAASYRAFGVSPLAARVPAAVLGMVTVLLVAWIGMRVWGRRAGLLAGFVLASCLQIAFIGRMGIMDVPLMFLTTVALTQYVRWRQRGRLRSAVLFGVLVGLAVLLKSLAGFIPALVAFVHALAFRRPERPPWARAAVVAVVCAAAVAGPWFYLVGVREPAFWPTFLSENFGRMNRPMQGHSGNLLYYLGFILLGFFPWVMFLPAAFRRGLGAGETKFLWRSLAAVWFAVVLVFFTLLKTKLPGYIVPLFPAMALLVGRELDRRLEEPGRAPWVAAAVGAVLFGVVMGVGLPLFAASLGRKVGAEEAAKHLAMAALAWGLCFALIALGAVLGGVRKRRTGLVLMAAGQTAGLAVVLLWIAPLLSPFMEGGREARLADLARTQLPGRTIVLYDAWPQGAAFALGRPVLQYGSGEKAELLARVRREPTALITPAGNDRPEFLATLPIRRTWPVGNYLLSDVPSSDPVR